MIKAQNEWERLKKDAVAKFKALYRKFFYMDQKKTR
jgi:hypothetical protein